MRRLRIDRLGNHRLVDGGSMSVRLIVIVWLCALLGGCGTSPPRNTSNSCAIFVEKSKWYRQADESYRKWGVPIHVQMAILYQESAFVDDARPPRNRLLWVIPWKRPSSAYGYAQATDGTWDWYRSATGNRGADRDDFADATDFVGWYGAQSHRRLGIGFGDAYNQYLAYHEGQGGYARGSYKNKAWLLKVARRVQDRARNYEIQLATCSEELNEDSWFWPF